MNQVAVDVWPVILPTILSAIALYIGFINKMRTQISVLEEKVSNLEGECDKATVKMTEMAHTNAVLEEKVKRSEMRQDSFSKKNDEVINLIQEFKLEMTEKIGHMSEGMIKIQSDVEVINKTIAVFDSGVVSKRKKK
jgi:hypothetical protein